MIDVKRFFFGFVVAKNISSSFPGALVNTCRPLLLCLPHFFPSPLPAFVFSFRNFVGKFVCPDEKKLIRLHQTAETPSKARVLC